MQEGEGSTKLWDNEGEGDKEFWRRETAQKGVGEGDRRDSEKGKREEREG
ncbi:hypothetical protein Csa_014774 [Cucumis sativus]|uniref:Uncharacterized protein n=1 Tax=Cucumis sativus TaxID=3659 RepID=A0A0A0KVL8_CUCSA|nr:hypothetical protein Csa_014774 [Cucumis sativus]